MEFCGIENIYSKALYFKIKMKLECNIVGTLEFEIQKIKQTQKSFKIANRKYVESERFEEGCEN